MEDWQKESDGWRDWWIAVEQIKNKKDVGKCACSFWSKEKVDIFCELQKKEKHPKIYKPVRAYNDDGSRNEDWD